MTPRERVIGVLNHEKQDVTPFTVYESFLYMCQSELELRNRGMCIVKRITSYTINYPNIVKTTRGYTDEKGRNFIETRIRTPVGELSQLDETAGFTVWNHEKLFKTPDDYKALLFMIKDTVVTPSYDKAEFIKNDLGEGCIVRDQIPLEPLQTLISSYMGVEESGFQWMDNRDEIFKLYEALVDVNRRIYPIVAKGPLPIANYGGNVIPAVVGAENFRKYFVPHYNECAEIMHKNNKLLGVHFDDNNIPILDDIAMTDLDYIEAYDVGMNPSLKESKSKLKDKILWLNFPSAWHLHDVKTIENETCGMLAEAGSDDVIIGITEDVPSGKWQVNFKAIMDGIDKFHKVNS